MRERFGETSTLRSVKQRTDFSLIEPLNGWNRASQVKSDAAARRLKLSEGDIANLVNAKIFSRTREQDPVSISVRRPDVDALNSGGAQGLLDYLQENDPIIFKEVHEYVLTIHEREADWACWTTPDEVCEKESALRKRARARNESERSSERERWRERERERERHIARRSSLLPFYHLLVPVPFITCSCP